MSFTVVFIGVGIAIEIGIELLPYPPRFIDTDPDTDPDID
jgi:hypothetical protein